MSDLVHTPVHDRGEVPSDELMAGLLEDVLAWGREDAAKFAVSLMAALFREVPIEDREHTLGELMTCLKTRIS